MTKLKRAHNVFSVLLTTLILFGIAAPLSLAQDQKFTGLLIRTPAEYGGFTYEYFMNPGETKCDFFIAQHDYSEKEKAVTLYSMPTDLELDPQTGTPTYPRGTFELDHEFSVAKWVSMEKDEITLNKWGDNENMNFCVTVPEDASPGSHYGQILMSNISQEEFLNQKLNAFEEQQLNGAGLASRQGINLIVTVAGDINTNIQFDNMQVLNINYKKPMFGKILEFLPARLLVTLRNNGNQIIKPGGNIFIYKKDPTKPVATFVFNSDEENSGNAGLRVFPMAVKKYEKTWDDGFMVLRKDDSGKVRLKFNLENIKNIRFGKYNASLQVTYYDNNGTFQRVPDQVISFWVIPWRIIIAVIVLVVLYVVYKKNSNKRIEEKIKKKIKTKEKKR